MPRITEPSEVAHAIGQLGEGMTEEILAEAVRRGQGLARSATENHPRTAPGWFGWAETVCALRDQILPLGGRKEQQRGFETCVCPSGNDVIAALAGDLATGTENDPQPKYTKGRPVAQDVIARSQMDMFRQDDVTRAGPRLWFLLVRYEGGRAIAELSRPATINDSGRVDSWFDRIILQPIPIDSTPIDSAETEYTPAVDIDVAPRE